MQTNPDILLLEEPTRGIDVNAKTEVYKLITQYVQQGKGVVMVSSEEEEVLGICDKVIVVRNGKINKVLDAASASLEEIKSVSYTHLDVYKRQVRQGRMFRANAVFSLGNQG